MKEILYLSDVDSRQLILGASQDLKLYHDGSNSTLVNSTGVLTLKNTGDGKLQLMTQNAQDVEIKTNNELSVKCNNDGAVELYYDGGNSPKFATTSTGAEVTGKLEVNGNVSSTTQFSGFQGLRVQNSNGAAHGVTADINFVAGTSTTNRGAVIGVEYSSVASGNNLYFGKLTRTT